MERARQSQPGRTFILSYFYAPCFHSHQKGGGGVEKKLLCSLVESLCNTVASRRAAINLHRPVSKITTSPGRYHSVPTPGIAQVSPDSCTYVLGVTLVHCGQWRSGRHLVCFIGRSAMRRAGQSKSRHGAVREGERRLCSSLHPL